MIKEFKHTYESMFVIINASNGHSITAGQLNSRSRGKLHRFLKRGWIVNGGKAYHSPRNKHRLLKRYQSFYFHYMRKVLDQELS